MINFAFGLRLMSKFNPETVHNLQSADAIDSITAKEMSLLIKSIKKNVKQNSVELSNQRLRSEHVKEIIDILLNRIARLTMFFYQRALQECVSKKIEDELIFEALTWH